MKKILEFLRPGDFAWGSRELLVMRLGIAGLVFMGIHWGLTPFEPKHDNLNGFAKIVPLTWMLQPGVMVVLKILTTVGLGLFVIGIAPVITLVPPLFTFCGLGALRNSKGDGTHTTQVLAMALLAVWIAYIVGAIRKAGWKSPTLPQHRNAMIAALLMIAASYVSSGIIKLKATKGRWIHDVPNMAVQMIKSNLSDYYSKPQGEIPTAMTETAPKFITQNPNVARVVFGTGLLLELAAFTLMLGRRWAFLTGTALVLMHAGISLLMDIEFWNHMGLLCLLCIMPGCVDVFKKLSNSGMKTRLGTPH